MDICPDSLFFTREEKRAPHETTRFRSAGSRRPCDRSLGRRSGIMPIRDVCVSFIQFIKKSPASAGVSTGVASDVSYNQWIPGLLPNNNGNNRRSNNNRGIRGERLSLDFLRFSCRTAVFHAIHSYRIHSLKLRSGVAILSESFANIGKYFGKNVVFQGFFSKCWKSSSIFCSDLRLIEKLWG